MAYAVTPTHTWKRLKEHIPNLLRLCIFPLCCFDQEDAELWADDPHEYIRKVLLGALHNTLMPRRESAGWRW